MMMKHLNQTNKGKELPSCESARNHINDSTTTVDRKRKVAMLCGVQVHHPILTVPKAFVIRKATQRRDRFALLPVTQVHAGA
jgi:hypothetical protein